MPEGLIARIEREAGVPNLFEILSERLEPTDLQSLLLEVHARRAQAVTTKRLLEQYESNRFVAASPADPRLLVEVERLAWQLLPTGYEPIELSPLCPLGTNSAVATVHQNKVVATDRNTEVVADSSNVLALECALQRRRLRQIPERMHQPVLLASSHRLTRAQKFEAARSWPHFRAIALCAAGRDEGNYAFETRNLLDQIGFCVHLLRHVPKIGVAVSNIRIALSDFSDGSLADLLEREVLPAVSGEFPDASCDLYPERTAGRGYYGGITFKLFARVAQFGELELADGGCTRWTQQLLSDSKERLVICGIGTERLCAR